MVLRSVYFMVKFRIFIPELWDFIGQKINQRNPKCQNIDKLRTAILQERQQFPQERLRRLVRSMTKRVTELHNKRGGYTCYRFLCLTHHQGLYNYQSTKYLSS
jgi:hypothetical protein